MKKYLIFLFLFFCSTSLADFPWICYGATIVNGNSNLDNPTPNVNGLVGEVTSLPYTVPEGYELVITAYSIEGGKTPQYALIPWIGNSPITNAKCLQTCASAYGSNLYSGMNWVLPEGMKINLRLANASNDGISYCFGWHIEGFLRAVE